MKRAVLLLLALSMLLLPVAHGLATATKDTGPKIYVVSVSDKDYAEVRDYFRKGKPVIDTLPNGAEVELLPSFSPDGKYNHVLYNEGKNAGWILGKDLKKK